MNDEVLARLAPLVGVVLAGEDERLLDAPAVDRQRGLVGVLLDDREQVGEQAPLGRRQVGAVDGAVVGGVGDDVDGRAVAVVDGRAVGHAARGGAVALALVSHAVPSACRRAAATKAVERSRSVCWAGGTLMSPAGSTSTSPSSTSTASRRPAAWAGRL